MTTEATEKFFSQPSTQAALRRLGQELETDAAQATQPKGLAGALNQVVDLMIANPAAFDSYATVNAEWIGSHFTRELSSYAAAPKDKKEELLRSLFTSAYRFLCEVEFTQPGEPSSEVRRVISFVHENLESFSTQDRQQLTYASYLMPAQISKRLISNPAIAQFRDFAKTVAEARSLKDAWDKDFEERRALINGLGETISKVASEYNFVGLVGGFRDLRSRKDSEKTFAYRSLVGIALAMLALPLTQLGFVLSNLDSIESHKSTLVYSLPTLLALEIILLYFFRVVLGQFRSVKAQLLQLDLRISLCQFIESYSDYVSKVRKSDAGALSKFESLVFSGLVAGEQDIPSTFDGAEQIAALIRSVRGSGRADA